MTFHRTPVALVACFVAALMTHSGQAQVGTQITYQGELQQGSTLANGAYEMQFTPYATAVGGVPIALSGAAVVNVVNGKFTVQLNFGTAFNNINPFLEFRVRPSGSTDPFTLLTPRQPITAVPNSLWAAQAGSATNALNANSATTATSATTASTATNATNFGGQAPAFYQNAANLNAGVVPDARLGTNVARLGVNQTFTGFNVFNNPANLFTGGFSGSGGALLDLNASAITSGTIANARTTGTSNNSPNTLVLRNTLGDFSARQINATIFVGDGANVSNLNASNIATGTIANARTTASAASAPDTLVVRDALGRITSASFAGNGGLLTGLDANNITFGTLAVARLPATVVRQDRTNLFGLNNTFEARVGMGIAAPEARLHVRGETNIAALFDSTSVNGSWLSVRNTTGGNDARYWSLISTGTGNGIAGNLHVAVGVNPGIADSTPMVITRQGRVGIGTTNPAANLDVIGTTRTGVLEITGGSDIAEPYCVASSEGVEPAPGLVVSIDPDHVGKLRISSNAYDTTVAGIISGANGVNVGLTLRQEGSNVADGSLPIANVGRVWCWVDADAGAVQPGDLLTTSDTPGHAMKADPVKANGAILGKAMSRLESGKGMVLVLVGLQ